MSFQDVSRILGLLLCAHATLSSQTTGRARLDTASTEPRPPSPAGELNEIPGERVLSTRMIARPLQRAAQLARGVSDAEAGQRMASARHELGRYAVLRHVSQTDEYIFHVPAGSSPREVVDELMAGGNFQYVEPDWLVYPVGPAPRQQSGPTTPAGPPLGGVSPHSVTRCPDDPLFAQQWHHGAERLESCRAWVLHTGEPTVSIGICDTGVRTTHQDLGLHRLEAYNAVDHLWESQGGQIGPIYPHGTRTTGAAAANGDNGLGVVGVGWNLAHRMLRVSNFTDGSAYLSDLQHGARTSIESGDRVANVSYAGVTSASNLTTATYIKSIGGLLLWAAGNSASNWSFADRDADDLIVVGATDSNDVRAWFSCYGSFVDVFAPGVGIVTTDSASDASYVAADGTSYACPLTSGVCALIWSARPTLSPDDVERILKAGAEDIGAAGVDDVYGYGRINLRRSLLYSASEAPTASLSAQPHSGRSPLAVTFHDLSSGVPSSWLWDFGDGASSSLQNPVHTYTAAGAYTVTLAVANAHGVDAHTEVDAVRVDVIPPVADFSATPTSGLAPLAVSFTDLSSGGVPSAWTWSFGDGASSSLQDPSHVYTSSGYYTVTLVAANAYGSSSFTRSSYVTVDFIPPVADFSATPTAGASPIVVNFTDLSSGGAATSWAWYFGDGSFSTLQDPAHTYTLAGSYTVQLVTSNAYGSDAEVKSGYVVVSPGPTILANFTAAPTTGTAPLLVQFTDLSVGNIITWEWDFGDGTHSTLQNPTHVYTLQDQHNVSLTVTNALGKDSQLERSNYITVE